MSAIPERRLTMLVRFVAVLTAALALVAPAAAQTRLNVAIGADVNVVEVHKSLLGPGFKALAPEVELNVVGTGTGEPASRAIYTKIKAQADTGRKPWDLDVALVSMAVASQMAREGLLHRYVPQMRNAALVKGAEVKEAFGVSVDGYVVPMFHNQIAIAFNPAKVANPPRSFDDLAAWKNEGRMDPSITPTLPAPGLPIYPLYLVIPREAANKEAATRYIDYIATPEVQARAIVERFGWYPGIDAEKVLPLIAPKSRELLFKGVSAEDLARYSRQMPIKEYHDLITLAYEEIAR